MLKRKVVEKKPLTGGETGEVIKRDRWDKVDIIFKSVGSSLTALSVAAVGFFGSQYLTHRQETETNTRLYTELMSKREESDSSLRKDMFNSIITNILKTAPNNIEQSVLNLEMLAFNFHESLDLAPLFKDVRRQIVTTVSLPEEQKDVLSTRLEKVAKEIVDKQISTLIEAGGKIAGTIDFEELDKKPGGIPIIDQEVILTQTSSNRSMNNKRRVRIEALRVDKLKKEIRFRLEVGEGVHLDADVTYWVGFYNFPMLNNIRLPAGQRCSIVLTKYGESAAEIIFVYFPGSRASLKDKPYYDEVIYELLHARDHS